MISGILARFILEVLEAGHPSGTSLSDNPSVHKQIHTKNRDSPSCETNHRGYLVKTDGTDDPSACPYLYTDGLSHELPCFAQARPRRIIRLQYKSGHS